MPDATRHPIEHLNTVCTCATLDPKALRASLEAAIGNSAAFDRLTETHPHLMSAQPMFVSVAHAQAMQALVAAIERVGRHPAYRDAVLAKASPIAQIDHGPIGVFMGYDFHLGEDGPRLIEINTNAGGGLLNALLLQAQRICCMKNDVTTIGRASDVATLQLRFLDNFRAEWHRQGRDGTPGAIAIVDEAPERQYLYPEFLLFQRLFEGAGWSAVIAAPDDLVVRDGRLWAGSTAIDLVYNRSTDFDFSTPAAAALRTAYVEGLAVVTPNPRAHALFADKRNLAILTDAERLRGWGVAAADIATLAHGIPRTLAVSPADADALWENRDRLFFKPARGYGSKATYRGDKLTKRVFAEILAGDYVAQELVTPSGRSIRMPDGITRLKADIRCYAYDGQVELFAARLYQGQTTNFRTPGGGFAPVLVGKLTNGCGCTGRS